MLTVLCMDVGVGGCLEPENPNFGLKACGPGIIPDLSPMVCDWQRSPRAEGKNARVEMFVFGARANYDRLGTLEVILFAFLQLGCHI